MPAAVQSSMSGIRARAAWLVVAMVLGAAAPARTMVADAGVAPARWDGRPPLICPATGCGAPVVVCFVERACLERRPVICPAGDTVAAGAHG